MSTSTGVLHARGPMLRERGIGLRPKVLGFSCAVGILAASGCAGLKVKQPASDSTPPSLVWNVFNHDTREQADHPGSPAIQVQRGGSYRIILKANDPQGVQSIQMNPVLGGGELWWQCVTPPGGENLAQNKTATLGPLTQNLSPDGNGMVLTSIFLIQEMSFAMECQPGWNFASGGGKLTGRSSNYFGGITTEVISFSVSR